MVFLVLAPPEKSVSKPPLEGRCCKGRYTAKGNLDSATPLLSQTD